MNKKTIVAVNGFYLSCENSLVGEGRELVHSRALSTYGVLWANGFIHGVEAMESVFFSKNVLPENVVEVLDSDYIPNIKDKLNELGYEIVQAENLTETDWLVLGLGE